jgi:hypothetical protein
MISGAIVTDLSQSARSRKSLNVLLVKSFGSKSRVELFADTSF